MANLLHGFIRSVQSWPDGDALRVDGISTTYRELHRSATTLAKAIQQHDEKEAFVAFLAHRSFTAYQSVLGILLSGRAYVPLNPKFPIDRTTQMIRDSGVRTIVVGSEGEEVLCTLLESDLQPLTLICPDRDSVDDLASRFPSHRFVMSAETDDNLEPIPLASDQPDQPAYMLFTSGSTGTPKGVVVSHGNVNAYVDSILARYEPNHQDRFSQTFDMTFDLSVHDMFVSWSCGGCLCCVPERATMAPAKFIRDEQITMWFSVPSVITFMQRLRLLKPDSLPSIRVSLFCGEPLLTESAHAWQGAASQSVVDNLYGPTEATIAITSYRWPAEDPDDLLRGGGVVPIGHVFPHQTCCVIDNQGEPVAPGDRGELCLAGSQVTSGYRNNETKTKEQFVQLASSPEKTWYRTGDLVYSDETGCLHYAGRIDNQIQVRGHRVELQEVEQVMRRATGGQAVALGWPPGLAAAETVYGVIDRSGSAEPDSVLAECRKSLPEYMVPSRIFVLDELPLNANGKINRNAIRDLVQEKDQ